jgi:hypothetical protein
MTELAYPVTAAAALYALYHFAGLAGFVIVGVAAILLLKVWGDRGARR